MYVWYMWVCLHMCRAGVGSFPLLLLHLIFEAKCLSEPEAHCFNWSGWPLMIWLLCCDRHGFFLSPICVLSAAPTLSFFLCAWIVGMCF